MFDNVPQLAGYGQMVANWIVYGLMNGEKKACFLVAPSTVVSLNTKYK